VSTRGGGGRTAALIVGAIIGGLAYCMFEAAGMRPGSVLAGAAVIMCLMSIRGSSR